MKALLFVTGEMRNGYVFLSNLQYFISNAKDEQSRMRELEGQIGVRKTKNCSFTSTNGISTTWSCMSVSMHNMFTSTVEFYNFFSNFICRRKYQRDIFLRVTSKTAQLWTEQ